MDIPNLVIWVASGALLLLVLFLLSFLTVWVRARLAGAEVGLFDLVGMRLRGVPYGVIVDAKIAATKAASRSRSRRSTRTISPAATSCRPSRR
jgi:uncharacterized protein YqfA (UPF0365 family)